MTNSQAPPQNTLLIVDDDAIARAGLTTLLGQEGYQIVTAANGQVALDILHGGLVPDLILLDMILPVRDGWWFCGQKQSDRSIAGIPVVLMTGLQIASEEWAVSLGAVGLLRKPIDVPTLIKTVHRYSRPNPAG